MSGNAISICTTLPKPLRAFSFLEVEGEDDKMAPEDQVNLIAIAERDGK